MPDKIEVIGPGCRFCKKLYDLTSDIVKEKGIDAELSHITELKQVIRYVPLTPVLRINGEIVHRGKFLPGKEKLAAIIVNKLQL
ncbi:MAG TPA: thioredoxin family protein [Spirochaetota bacterium]|nr:thioredoxin family protein [Spirochaetota bacterium]HPV40135.1 thioredoxin family protein [Spirochaetota bacterium]